jgi:hypothetical protein
MTYTTKDFGRDLLIELSHGYAPLRLAQWADRLINKYNKTWIMRLITILMI